jgi:hypothetical protein
MGKDLGTVSFDFDPTRVTESSELFGGPRGPVAGRTIGVFVRAERSSGREAGAPLAREAADLARERPLQSGRDAGPVGERMSEPGDLDQVADREGDGEFPRGRDDRVGMAIGADPCRPTAT